MDKLTRRTFTKLVATSAAVGPFFSFARPLFASAQPLRIAKWKHFLPEFDIWFKDMARKWGELHGAEVIVDDVPIEDVYTRAKAECSASAGHDIFMFPWPPAEFQSFAINHGSVYQMVAGRYGTVPEIAFKSTYNFKSRKFFAFADSWIPAPLIYFEDCWQGEGMPYGPLTYGSLQSGGQRIREKMGIPCGLPMTSTLEGNITCHTILYAFGATMTNRKGEVRLDARTVAALNFAKNLYEKAGTPDALSWTTGGNAQSVLAHGVSCTISDISVVRMAEAQNPGLASQIRIAPPLLGSYGVTGFPHVTNCSVVWKFSENQMPAQQFLADMMDQSKAIYEKSRGCNFPAYQKAVPDLIVRLEKDPQAMPSKYKELKDALHWTPNLGAPGIVTPTWMEAFNKFLVPKMFRSVVNGESGPLEAARTAEAEMKQIAEKWKSV